MLDPVSAAVAIVGLRYVGQPAAELVREFLAKVLTPVADALGQVAAHPIEEFHRKRVERANTVIVDAAVIAQESGQQVQEVPGRVLWPLLEKASLEDDDVLKQRWTQLLANASIGALQSPLVLPAFVHILGELSSDEVRLLDFVRRSKPESSGGHEYFVVRLQAVHDALELPSFQRMIYLANLERLNLLNRPETPIADLVILRDEEGGQIIQSHQAYILSWLGMAFLDACTTEPYPAIEPHHI